jgi:glycosyltransferase involved in cell wall biosynthesis
MADAGDLALQLYWMITHPKECEASGREARSYVERFYRWDGIARATAELYRSLDKGRGESVRSPMPAAGVNRRPA